MLSRDPRRAHEDYRFQSTAVLVMQEAAETFLVHMFEQCNHIYLHTRQTCDCSRKGYSIVEMFIWI